MPVLGCILCSMEETLKQLFIECEFTKTCWTVLHTIWDLPFPVTDLIEQQN
jgi:hypothetical protein